MSENARQARKINAQKRFPDEAARHKHADTLRAIWKDPARSEALLAARRTDKARRLTSETVRAMWAAMSEEDKAARCAHMRKGLLRVTRIELAVSHALNNLKVSYHFHQDYGVYVVDFYVPSHGGVILECDGTYWHQEPNLERDKILSEHARVVHLLEKDIKRDAVGVVARALGIEEEVSGQ